MWGVATTLDTTADFLLESVFLVGQSDAREDAKRFCRCNPRGTNLTAVRPEESSCSLPWL